VHVRATPNTPALVWGHRPGLPEARTHAQLPPPQSPSTPSTHPFNPLSVGDAEKPRRPPTTPGDHPKMAGGFANSPKRDPGKSQEEPRPDNRKHRRERQRSSALKGEARRRYPIDQRWQDREFPTFSQTRPAGVRETLARVAPGLRVQHRKPSRTTLVSPGRQEH